LDCEARGLSENTIRFYKEKLSGFIKFCEDRSIFDIQELSSVDIREFFVQLKSNHTQGGIHAYFRAIRVFLLWYEEENEFTDWKNPIKRIKVKPANEGLLEPADINAIKAILKTCINDFYGIRDKAIILILLDTGMRASELLSLDKATVNPITGVIQILHGKGGKIRNAYISKKTRFALRKYLNLTGMNNGPLITSKEGYRLKYQGLRCILRRRSKKAKVPYQPLHSFRRLFALTMLRNGTDIFSLQMLMGHADIQVLRRYLKIVSNDLQSVHFKASPVMNLDL
jgi:integrase/recombinase XerD